MLKQEVYERELDKLKEIFKDVEETKRKLVEGLIEDAAFLKAENDELKKTLAITGMVKTHPNNTELQKPLESGKQYLKNINSYSVVIKTLNSVLNANVIDDDDTLGDYE